MDLLEELARGPAGKTAGYRRVVFLDFGRGSRCKTGGKREVSVPDTSRRAVGLAQAALTGSLASCVRSRLGGLIGAGS